MECFGCLVQEVLSETLSPMHQREPVNIGLEYWNTGLEYWNTGLEYWNTGLEYWNTGLEYWNTGLEYWNTGLEYWTGILDWNTGILEYWTGLLEYCMVWSTGLDLHFIPYQALAVVSHCQTLASFPGSPPTQGLRTVRRGKAWYPFTRDVRYVDVTAKMN